MTRINLVSPSELTDQHLFAEFREIKMVPKSLARSLQTRKPDDILKGIPEKFTLNKGHVTFFYNKGLYLRKRFDKLKTELTKRGVQFNKESLFDPDQVMFEEAWNNDYRPDSAAIQIIRSRIAEKIAMKPHWYRKTSTT